MGMRRWNRREFVGFASGALGGLALPGIAGSVLTGCAVDGTRGSVADPDLPPRTVGLRTQGGVFRFDPAGLRLEAGGSLTWLNMGDFHTTTAYHPDNSEYVGKPISLRIPEGAAPWHSGMLGLDAGTQFERTFQVEGVYDYFCQPHFGFGMVGRLVVGAPHDGPALHAPASELPEAARGNLPDVESIMGETGRTFEWASRINGALLLLANGQPIAVATDAVVRGAEADGALQGLLGAAGADADFRGALAAFADLAHGAADYERLVSLADAAKEVLAAARV